jgi:16S rRNA (uracil1498-N3)-methyltransferase
MAFKSIYLPGARDHLADGRLSVTGDEHQHLRVSRTGIGEAVEVFDGTGNVWSGEVVGIERSSTRIEVISERAVPPPAVELILAQALIKNAAFELVLEKAVELGVTRIVPVRAARSNETGTGREQRWRRIVVEATKQSKQYWIPLLDPVAPLESALGIEAKTRILFSERGGAPFRETLDGPPALCLVGPEGGWVDGEIAAAREAGFSEAHFTNRVLRAETAAILGMGLVASELGAM